MRLTHETVWTDHTTDTNRPQEPCLHRNKISNKENNGFVKLETAEKNLLQDNRTYYKTTEPITRTYYKTTEPITRQQNLLQHASRTCQLALSSSFKPVLFVTISPTLLSKLIYAFVLSRFDYCNPHFSLGVPKIRSVNFKKFKLMLPASFVVLPGLTTYLQSFVLYTGFLSNPAFTTKLLFWPLNHWTTKPLSTFLISSSSMLHLTNSVRLPILDSFSSICSPQVLILIDASSSIKHRFNREQSNLFFPIL